MIEDLPFPFELPEELQLPVLEALQRVVDPEVAMNIVDVGLIYGVQLVGQEIQLEITMTSAACPVADVIMDDIERELDRVLPPEYTVRTELVWDPPWTSDRMSESARNFMGW